GVVHLLLDFRVGPLADAVKDIAAGDIARVDWNARLDQGYTLELVAVAGFWALFNAAKCFYLICNAGRDARSSTEHCRVDGRLPAEIAAPSGRGLARVERISQSWIAIRTYDPEPPTLGQKLPARLYLPGGTLSVDCIVKRRREVSAVTLKVGRISI